MPTKSIVTHLARIALLLAASTLSTGAYAQVALNLTTGWNLLGNSSAAPVDVATTFGDATKIATVWKWNKIGTKWAFYAPSMTPSALTTYTQAKGYDVLTSIDLKEGFWVNASTVVTLTGPVANAVTLVQGDLQQGWNLVGSADNKTPSQLNQGLSSSLNSAGKAIITAWAWDAQNAKWKFFAPALETQGGTALADYVTNKGYLPFSIALSAADGFWLNIGAASGSGPGPAGGSGTLTIVKDAQPDDPQVFHFTAVGAGLSDFDLVDNGAPPNSKTFTNLAAGVAFTVTEGAVSGWTVPSIQCIVAVPGSTTTFTDQLNRTFTVNLEAGANVTCTFINVKASTTGSTTTTAPTTTTTTTTAASTTTTTVASTTTTTQAPAKGAFTLTIVKDAQPDDPQVFHFTTVGAGLSDFDLVDNGAPPNTITFTNLAAGSYSVTEVAMSGWTASGTGYQGSINCYDTGTGTHSTFTPTTNSVTVDFVSGNIPNVTCTFINVKASTVGSTTTTTTTAPTTTTSTTISTSAPTTTTTVAATTTTTQAPATGAFTLTIVKDAQPDDPQAFHFTTVGAGLSDFDLVDNGTPPNSKTFTNLAAGSYSVTEVAMNGWTASGTGYQGSINCYDTGTGTHSTFTPTANSVTVDFVSGNIPNVTCTFINVKTSTPPFMAIDAPTLQVSTQAMVPTVLMTSTAYTSTTTGGVTTANVTAGPIGVSNDGVFTFVSPYSDPLVGAVATLPSSILLTTGPLSMTSTSLGSSVGLTSADFGRWAITDAVAPQLPVNSIMTYITFAGGTQLTSAMPSSGMKTYTGRMTGVLANIPIGGSDEVSADVSVSVSFANNGTGTITSGFLTSNIVPVPQPPLTTTITPCVWPLAAAACTYSSYAFSAYGVQQGFSPLFTDISVSSGTISGNSFSATVTTPSIAGATIMTMKGHFYGATANEIAGTFTISAPSLGNPSPGFILIGSFGAKQ